MGASGAHKTHEAQQSQHAHEADEGQRRLLVLALAQLVDQRREDANGVHQPHEADHEPDARGETSGTQTVRFELAGIE